jgi:hypothetical protein
MRFVHLSPVHPLDVSDDRLATGLEALVDPPVGPWVAGAATAGVWGRRRVAAAKTTLGGVDVGNPKRATAHPTAERLRDALQGLTRTGKARIQGRQAAKHYPGAYAPG